jgi:hypothetical protein
VELAPEYPVVTTRLLLRPLSEADIDGLVAYRSLEEVCGFVPFEPMSAAVARNKLKYDWSRRARVGGPGARAGAQLSESAGHESRSAPALKVGASASACGL